MRFQEDIDTFQKHLAPQYNDIDKTSKKDIKGILKSNSTVEIAEGPHPNDYGKEMRDDSNDSGSLSYQEEELDQFNQ